MVDQNGDQSGAAGNRAVGNQSAKDRAVTRSGQGGPVSGVSGVKYPFPKPRLIDEGQLHRGNIESVLHHLQERALEEMGDLFAQLRRTAIEPEKQAPSDLNGYVLVKRCDLVPLVISVYGPDEANKRMRDLIYAYPRQGDD
jgi:hypothetical protein